jgi:hypothetical protein
MDQETKLHSQKFIDHNPIQTVKFLTFSRGESIKELRHSLRRGNLKKVEEGGQFLTRDNV